MRQPKAKAGLKLSINVLVQSYLKIDSKSLKTGVISKTTTFSSDDFFTLKLMTLKLQLFQLSARHTGPILSITKVLVVHKIDLLFEDLSTVS